MVQIDCASLQSIVERRLRQWLLRQPGSVMALWNF